MLNTPTLRSMKWWPGALGRIGTHAAVYAQLIIDGQEYLFFLLLLLLSLSILLDLSFRYGIHCFLLQIRDENHKLFPGIEVGDLGPKLGDHANDTGE